MTLRDACLFPPVSAMLSPRPRAESSTTWGRERAMTREHWCSPEDHRRISVWRKRVEGLEASGQSCSDYARRIGVNANTLAGWRWKPLGAAGWRSTRARWPPVTGAMSPTPAASSSAVAWQRESARQTATRGRQGSAKPRGRPSRQVGGVTGEARPRSRRAVDTDLPRRPGARAPV